MRGLPRQALIPLEAGILGLAVGLLAVAPWIVGSAQGQFLLLTDWVSGPQSTVSAGLYGLSDEALDAMPWRIGVGLLRDIVGPAHAAWLLVLLPFPIAAAGAAHLVRGGRAGAYAAALVVTCSPMIIDRVAVGHVPFLMGMALLPWLVASARHARTQQRWFSARTTGWFALAVSISPHLAWIGGVALLIVTLVPLPSRRDLVRLALVVFGAAAVYAYAIAVLLAGVPTIDVGDKDLAAFATRTDIAGGLLIGVLTLRGFWRDAGDRVAVDLGPWGLPLALLLATVVVVGIIMLVRSGTTRGPLAAAFIAVGAVLATGTSGPFAPLHSLAFEYLPLFEAMREPQKWSALIQLGIAIAVAGAVQALVDSPRHRVQARVGAVFAAAIPLAILPSLAWGVGGTISTSTYPAGWSEVDDALTDEPTLFLPWHGYQPFTFTQDRSVATPAQAFFRPPMLASAAVEVGPLRTNSGSQRQRFVDELVASGGSPTFGSDLALLGIRQVVLARDAATANRYPWLPAQPGLTPLTANDAMDAYLVLPPTPGMERVRPTGPTSYAIDAGAAGEVILPVECSDGWQVDGHAGTCTAAGTVSFDVGPGATAAEYAPWSIIRIGVAISVLTLLALLAVGIIEHSRDDRRGQR